MNTAYLCYLTDSGWRVDLPEKDLRLGVRLAVRFVMIAWKQFPHKLN